MGRQARSCIRARAPFFNVVDLLNRIETVTRAGHHGRIADHLTLLDPRGCPQGQATQTRPTGVELGDKSHRRYFRHLFVGKNKRALLGP